MPSKKVRSHSWSASRKIRPELHRFCREALRIARKLELVHTPKHDSWLNLAEIELSVLTRQCLNRRIPNQAEVATESAAWARDRNQQQTTINWRFTTANARHKLKYLYPKIKL